MPCGKTYTALVARAGAGRTQPDAAPRTTAVFRKGRKGMALTWVWVGMVCVALIYGAATGQSAAVGAAAAQGVHYAFALAKRQGLSMPPAGAQGTRRARVPRNRQLSHHPPILNMGCKGAIGIASPACGHHGATVTLHSRCHLDYPFHKPNTTGQKPGNEPQTQKASRTATPRGRPNVKQTAPYASDFLA